MSVKKRKKGRRRRERQGNRSKFCLLYIQIAELSDRMQPSGRILNSILGNFHSSSQSDGGHKMARLHKYLFLFFHAFKKQESRHLKLLIVFIQVAIKMMHESLTPKGSLLFLLPNNTKISSQTTLATTSQFSILKKKRRTHIASYKNKIGILTKYRNHSRSFHSSEIILQQQQQQQQQQILLKIGK